MTGKDFLFNFLYSFLATVSGGAILALIFFWLREKIFPVEDLNGTWYFQQFTNETSFNPYKGMELRYIAMLWREDGQINGTVEKIYENSSTGEREYTGDNRTRGVVKGFVEKNYFSKDKLLLHIIEDGHDRESTNFHELNIISNSKLEGSFQSMVANQKGTTVWKRDTF